MGLLGSIRFGVYENFKKDIAYMKGTDGKPAVLELADKTIAAFATGLISSLGVVLTDLFSALSNTLGSGSRSSEDRQTRFTQVRWMLQSKSLNSTDSEGLTEDKVLQQ